MKISDTAYEALSPRQRIIATIDAMARDDTAEIDRLKTTCPIKSYRREDAAFRDVFEGLRGAELAVEADLLSEALWLIARHDDPECREATLQTMAAIEAAWLALLSDMGITSPAGAAPPRHLLVAVLLENAPEPEPERVAEYYAVLKASVFT
jgi:hypothetical protein